MIEEKTAQALSAITDEGLFERLATAILREADQNYRSLIHSGVNALGKTVKSPLDGICFIQGADPPHMIAVHHTATTNPNDLKKKWLNDPTKVKQRKGTRSKTLAGDLIKTAEIAKEERTRTPHLCVTLVLTTNQEPSEALVRDIELEGRNRDLKIDLWTRSRLSHFLDNQPSGQWIRHSFLNINQEQLSRELLLELSKKSLKVYTPLDNQAAWIPRKLDAILKTNLYREVVFLMAGSGLGKTVACHRMLAAHVGSGGFGIVLPHEVLVSAMTIEQAITTTLQQLHPPLTAMGPSALSFCSPKQPLLLIVEDINCFGQTPFLVEKLANWSYLSTKGKENLPPNWRLVCPLLPKVLASLGDQVKKRIEQLMIRASGFTESEGREAVLTRSRCYGHKLSSLDAEAISGALGHDPLLIALHDQRTTPNPYQTIANFVESALSRAAVSTKDHPTSEYRQAIRILAGKMLSKRLIKLTWSEVHGWEELQGYSLQLLANLADHGELIHFTGLSGNQQLSFRHDRVRDWILADSAAELDRQDNLSEEVMADPYFAELIGTVLVWGRPNSNFLKRVAALNPLALIYSLRLIDQVNETHREAIIQRINNWLDNPAIHDQSNFHLRWEAFAMLAETDFIDVPKLVQKISDQTISGQLARLRNGDISGGIEICYKIPPGTGAPWRDKQIEHAKLRYGDKYTAELNIFLRQTDLDSSIKIGALRLAGHFANSNLVMSIEACWIADSERVSHLNDYLWAFGKCCGNDPAHYLEPVCDAWATLPDKEEKEGCLSPQEELVEYGLRWAFQKWPPVDAIDYFIQRGSQDNLKWPITLMLRYVDHPKAILFVVQELAAIQSNFIFVHEMKRGWEEAQKNGYPMSQASRNLLLGLWQDEANNKNLRSQAFSMWSATKDVNDVSVLQNSKVSEDLANKILMQRLVLGDHLAIPLVIEKLATDDNGYWWQCGRYLWSSKMTDTLDKFLARRETQAKCEWGESFYSDWIIHELMIMQLPENEAERLLLKHWAHLRYSPYFVQAALYILTPNLVNVANNAINECPEPSKLMEHLSYHFGTFTDGHKGLTREAQVKGLVPYLHLLSPMDLSLLWEACNYRGWFAFRKKFLDDHLQSPYDKKKWNQSRAMLEFDELVTDQNPFRINDWIDNFMKTGIAWSEIIATMRAWLDERRSFEALQLVAAAVIHRGTREDLAVLTAYEGMSETEAIQLITDTRFAVRRNSIH